MNKKGFTLIELLAVIVILAIIALIALPIVLNIIESSRESAAERSASAYVKATENYIAQSKIYPNKYKLVLETNKKYYIYKDHEIENEKDKDISLGEIYIEDEIKVDGTKPTDGYIIIGNKGNVKRAYLKLSEYIIECENKNCKSVSRAKNEDTKDDEIEPSIKEDGIISYLNTSDFTSKTTSISSNGTKYNIHAYVYEGDQVWDSNQIFGDENDVGTEAEYAKNMVVVKVNGNLTINDGVTVSPYYTEYGGPKGFFIYVTGTLTNKGTIDNSHGAYAEGENVYLWKNVDGSYELIPKEGSLGGEAVTGSGSLPDLSGNSGKDGNNRSTGGGGSGAIVKQTGSAPNRTSGSGSRGTSYSGGSGGASVFGNIGGIAEPAYENGGAGGSATINASRGTYKMGGGAGNPGGKGKIYQTFDSNYDGQSGTGGLLIIYASNVNNIGTIKAEGSNGGIMTNVSYAIGGSGSGGGSINIFYKNSYSSTGIISSKGGVAGIPYTNNYGSTVPGNGGNGSITIGSIASGSFDSN